MGFKICGLPRFVVAIWAVRKGAAAEVSDYILRGHDPTAVAVMKEVVDAYMIGKVR